VRKSNRRQLQAAQTHRDILSAARVLFARQGYVKTPLAQIAEMAGVSVQTIYDSVGSKSDLLAALNDLIDEESDIAALASQIPTETDPRSLLNVAVSMAQNVCERCGDIIGAVYGTANVEPALATVRDESRRRHRSGIAWLTGRLAEISGIRPGISQKQAADTIAALTDPQVVQTFVIHYGWSWEAWHAWTLETLVTLLLPKDAALGPV
jgi:AcrR family transcriptional regulator